MRRLKFEEVLDKTGEVGYVELVSYPIVYIEGLPGARREEIIVFECGAIGQVQSLSSSYIEVLLFSQSPIKLGSKATRLGEVLSVPVGEHVLGHTIDPLGSALYEGKLINIGKERRTIESKAPGIHERGKVTKPLETGVAVVDLMVPLGMGQRELVIGDRKIGKTNFLLQTIANQARKGTICIYAAVGKKKADIKKIEQFVIENKIQDKVCIIASSSTDSAGVIYLTPYSAMTLAEYFKDKGQDVLLVLDDLSTHAKFYREISLLGGRFPGRNSYPGDIFFTHGRLFERAGNFKVGEKDVSITCLATAETVGGDISGYIQTNLMSMTDGHIFFDLELFTQGRRPAVNYSLSVTRVGRQTQTPVRSGISRELSNFLTLYEKTQSFVHFGAELGEGARSTLAMGARVLDFFNQPFRKTMDLDLQIVLFCLIWVGIWTKEPIEQMRIDTKKIMIKYEEDETYQKMVCDLIAGATSFNELLGKISAQSNTLFTKEQTKEKNVTKEN